MTYSLAEQENMLRLAAYGFEERFQGMKKMIITLSDKDTVSNDVFVGMLGRIHDSSQSEFMRAMIVMKFIFLNEDSVKILPALVNYTNNMLISFEFPFAPRC